MRNAYTNAFVRAGVDLVLTGHAHYYDRLCAISSGECNTSLSPDEGERVHIITDSQSLVAAIKKGIARQADARIADIWRKLVALVRDHRCLVTIHFAFGHSNWVEADVADHHAKSAATRRRSAEWWVDKARVESAGPIERHLRSALRGTLRSKVIDLAPGYRPSRWRSGTAPHSRVRLCRFWRDCGPTRAA